VARFSSNNWLNHPVIHPDNMIIVSDGRDDSLMITDYNNIISAVGLDNCNGETFDLHLIEDLDADGNVNFADFALLAKEWLNCTDIFRQAEARFNSPWNYIGDEIFLTSDIDRDRYTSLSDLVMMLDRWLGSTRMPKGPMPMKQLGSPLNGHEQSEPTPPPPKGRACFISDTPVWIDGELVRISDTVSRQIIGKYERNPVTSYQKQIDKVEEHEGIFDCYDVVLETGDCLSVAASHYFLTDFEQWIRVQDLNNGSRLKSLNGPVRVTQIIKRQKPHIGKCYNLKIKGMDHYFVGQDGIIVRDW
jgi:hypothetical protein